MQAEGTKVGQYVTADPVAYPDLAGQRLLITEVAEVSGSEPMLTVRSDQTGLVTGFGGRVHRFIWAKETQPAQAILEPSDAPRIVERDEPMQNLETDVLALAADYQKRLHLSAPEAAKKAGADVLTTEKKQQAYRGITSPREPLRSPTEKQVRAEIEDVVREHGCSPDDAAEMIIATSRASAFRERVMNLRASGLDATTALMRAQREDPQGATAWREAGLIG